MNQFFQEFWTSLKSLSPLHYLTGAVILLGKTNMFRFNHPAEAAKMREELKSVSKTGFVQIYIS